MKILAIRGKNLASLEGEFEIDFTSEPLKSAGIFAITGQTGAGKSTILDALCLALFDNAPRLNKAEASVNVADVEDKTITQKDSRNILRRGASEGFAEVDFIALNGDLYRSKWMVRRARGKADGALQATSIKLDNLTTKGEEQGTKSNLLNRIVELIGLNFDQFTRAVLLAQGDFANFLKAKSSEKAELLEKLTGTEIYSKISISIYQKTSDAKNALDLVLQRMKDVRLLTDEELSNLSVEKEGKSDELVPLKSETEKINKKLAWIKENELILKDLYQAEESLATIQKEIESSSSRYEYMGMIDKSFEIRDSYVDFINKRHRLEELGVELDTNEKKLIAISEQSEKVNIDLSEVKSKGEQLNKKHNEIVPEINLAKELDIKRKSSLEKLSELKNELDVFQKQLADADQNIASLKTSQERAIKEKRVLDLWFSENEYLKSIVSKVDLLQNLIQTAYATKKQYSNAQYSLKTNREMLVSSNEQLKTLENEAEQLNRLLPAEVLNLRRKLIEGEPCLVCGSTHHPLSDAMEQSRKVNEEELEKTKKAVQANIDLLKSRIEGIQKGITEFETHSKNSEEQYENSIDNLRNNLSLFPDWESKFNSETLETELSDIASLWNVNKTKLEGGNSLLEKITVQLETQEKGKSPILEIIRNKEKSYQSEETTSLNNKKERNALLEGKAVDEVEKYFSSTRESLLKEFETLSSDKERADSQLSLLKGKIEQQKKDAESRQKEIDELTLKIKDWLSDESHRINTELLKELMSKSREWITQEKNALTELLNSRLSVEATLVERRNRKIKHQEVEVRPLDDESEEILTTYKNDISEKIEIISKRLSEIEVLLLTHERGKDQIKSFEKELKEKTELYENWAKLNDLLGSANGNKFKTIAQGYTLDVLLSYANKHLDELTQRYSLEKIPDTLALQVFDRDIMQGGVRSVHSLSGGESFLVSLALALGLSSLSSNKMKIESLFIDEGFGSLDIDTLSIAMDALDNLQTQGRKIGVISHVEEMKERITTQIQVVKSANSRSSIKIVG